MKSVRDAACEGACPRADAKETTMQRAVGMGRAKHFSQNWPLLLPGRRGGAGSFARNGRVPVRRRTRRFGHAALAPCSVFAPRRTTRRQRRVWLGWHRAAGGEKPARAPPCLAGLIIQTRKHHPAEAEPGSPHVVRIGTDTFLCPEKCPGRRVRWGWAGRSTFRKAALPFVRAARRCGGRAVLRGAFALFHVEQCGEAAGKCSTWNIGPRQKNRSPRRGVRTRAPGC